MDTNTNNSNSNDESMDAQTESPMPTARAHRPSDTPESLKAERANLEKTIAWVRQMTRDFDTATERRKAFDAKRVAFHLQLKNPDLRRCVWKGFTTPKDFQWYKPAIARKKALAEQALKDAAVVCEALVRWAEDLEKREQQQKLALLPSPSIPIVTSGNGLMPDEFGDSAPAVGIDSPRLAKFSTDENGIVTANVDNCEIVILYGHGSSKTPHQFNFTNPQCSSGAFIGCYSAVTNSGVQSLIPGSPMNTGQQDDKESWNQIEGLVEHARQQAKTFRCCKIVKLTIKHVRSGLIGTDFGDWVEGNDDWKNQFPTELPGGQQ